MATSKVDLFMATNANKFPPEQVLFVRQHLESLDDAKMDLILSLNYKDPTMILIISILLGGLGIDRFMLGDVGLGVGKLLTAGGCGIWAIIDWFLVMGAAREKNLQLLMSIR